jgi:hypothetical protein
VGILMIPWAGGQKTLLLMCMGGAHPCSLCSVSHSEMPRLVWMIFQTLCHHTSTLLLCLQRTRWVKKALTCVEYLLCAAPRAEKRPEEGGARATQRTLDCWRLETQGCRSSAGRLGSPAKLLLTNRSRHMLLISYIICKELQPLCTVSSCSKRIWALTSLFSSPATALHTVPVHCIWRPSTMSSSRLDSTELKWMEQCAQEGLDGVRSMHNLGAVRCTQQEWSMSALSTGPGRVYQARQAMPSTAGGRFHRELL